MQSERESNIIAGYCLKCDIRHYFETVDQEVLLSILQRRINDEEVIWLVKTILQNHKSGTPGKGMPLGNLTSQFLANVYLAELDNFVKHELRVKYYLRYVDDFILLSRNRLELAGFKSRIETFLLEKLKLRLHPAKSRIIPLSAGVTMLGFRVFLHYKLLKKSNQNRIWKRLEKFRRQLENDEITEEKIQLSLAGWNGYAKMGNTFRLREKVRVESGIFFGNHPPKSF